MRSQCQSHTTFACASYIVCVCALKLASCSEWTIFAYSAPNVTITTTTTAAYLANQPASAAELRPDWPALLLLCKVLQTLCTLMDSAVPPIGRARYSKSARWPHMEGKLQSVQEWDTLRAQNRPPIDDEAWGKTVLCALVSTVRTVEWAQVCLFA